MQREAGTPLYRAFHISDLHFGRPSHSAWVQPLLRLPGAHGLAGHDGLAVAKTARLHHQFRRDRLGSHVVVSGDLTVSGHPTEFAVAEEFLSGTSAASPSALPSLWEPAWARAAIPGNHDMWHGQWPPGAKVLTAASFPMDPFDWLGSGYAVSPPITAAWSHDPRVRAMIRLIRLDTDSDVHSPGERFRAIGRCDQALTVLDRELRSLGPRKAREVRVAVLHHCPSPRPTWTTTMALDQTSYSLLMNLLHDHDIRVVMTGHTHEPEVLVRPNPNPWLEACCGSTTQIASALKLARLVTGVSPPMARNSLVVHHLLDVGLGALQWVAQVWAPASRWRSFEPAGPRVYIDVT